MAAVLGDTSNSLTTLYIPSNTKCEYFKNKTSHFKVDLSDPIDLKPGSKIALSEIIYPNSILNVYKSISRVYLQKEPGLGYVRFLKENYYSTDEQLFDEINNVLEEADFESRVRKNGVVFANLL